MATTRKKKPLNQTDPQTKDTISDRFPFRHSLDRGNSGVLVMWAQSKLMKHGFYNGPLDGRYDTELVHSVRKYQDASNLRVTGVIDRATWESL